MRISDWSSDVCSSDLRRFALHYIQCLRQQALSCVEGFALLERRLEQYALAPLLGVCRHTAQGPAVSDQRHNHGQGRCLHCSPGYSVEPQSSNEEQKSAPRSEEHTSELQSLMRISYAVFCLKK